MVVGGACLYGSAWEAWWKVRESLRHVGSSCGVEDSIGFWGLGSESFRAEDEALRDELDGTGNLVAEWIHFTLFWVILPTIKQKVYTFWGL